jgi:hypothetical protein
VAVEYSNDNGTSWSYQPVSGGCGAPAGYDGCVTRLRWRVLSPFPSTAGSNSGAITFTTRIR